ncbi:phenylacetic acid degradation operon negative regulatory protein PaaX [Variovorax sp. J22R133]|uniref:phenylacetic acid degradation operon negative regulatory protein PaaX n=1 Tax=Variovorax brevis TaxID=3053503 RepID=UPI00257500ED|nr:phenylacetic acid degradation operon negative regulatory protein PaaX [Variovorax sp. J22R133]MDM0112905.1 phenylacetic acid degradation operon negative regulatory protein PaaX [Variovorax sp. J22R133]
MQRPTFEADISPELAKLRRGLELRANSVLITVYGDAIAPRRQAVWLGSLIRLVEPFGISSRLVRTSAFRLTADEWFTATRVGRRSYYGLSDAGLLRVQHADRRIYEFNLPSWDGRWTLVLLEHGMRSSMRQNLKRELLWESFGQLMPGIFAHPHADHRSLKEILRAAGAQDHVAVLSAQSLDDYARKPLQAIMRDTFKLDTVGQAWQQFIVRFAPAVRLLDALTQAESFFLRTLLIHEYRRVLLRDPNLPAALLPADWPGVQARDLCEVIYRGVLARSEQYLCVHMEAMDGPLARTPRQISRRLSPGRSRSGTERAQAQPESTP